MMLGMPQLYEFDTIGENLILAKELGLDFIELNLNFSYCRKEMENGNIPNLLKKYNLQATLHFYDEADLGSYDEVVEAYQRLLDKYCSLGKGYIKYMNIHLVPGPVVTISGIKNYIYEKEFDEYIKRLIYNLHMAEKTCNFYGIQMMIENTDNIPEYTKRTYNELVKAGFKFCLDIGHDHLSNDIVYNLTKELPLEFLEFHFHDAKNRKTCHLSLGDGEINLKQMKELAKKHNAWINLEVKQKEDLIKSVPIFREL